VTILALIRFFSVSRGFVFCAASAFSSHGGWAGESDIAGKLRVTREVVVPT